MQPAQAPQTTATTISTPIGDDSHATNECQFKYDAPVAAASTGMTR